MLVVASMSTKIIGENLEGQGYVIDTLYAVITIHGPGDEGIFALMPEGRTQMQCAFSDKKILERLLPYVRDTHRHVGKAFKIVRFVAQGVEEC